MVVLFVLVAFAMCDIGNDWHKFKLAYGKSYVAAEEATRFNIFKTNVETIKRLNKLDTTATYSINKYADLTESEFKTKFLRPMASSSSRSSYTPDLLKAPSKWDWEEKGVVGSVKNQGDCGSCWSFAVVGAVESHAAINKEKLQDLSEQQLVDCNSPPNAGCDGGNLDLALRYVTKNGLMKEADYPYTARQEKCKYESTKIATSIDGHGNIPAGREDQMPNALYTFGPLPIAVNANPFQFYSSGILNPSSCNPNLINHAVLLVGYDTTSTSPYWRIRNSWGADWGENGYIRISFGKNTCGISEWVTYIR